LVQLGNGEQCDDGNPDNYDYCTNACHTAICGDGIPQYVNGEYCDDGNQDNTDYCTNACQWPYCGDNITQPVLGEQCDNGFFGDKNVCTNNCTLGRCGDGLFQPGRGEECDDGNNVNSDGCDSQCRWETKIVFVSSKLYNGNLGGLAGADAKCQSLAQAAGLPGTYLAWLSTTAASPSTRFTHHNGPYVTTTGVVVAWNWSYLTYYWLSSALSVTELGTSAPISPNNTCLGGGHAVVWTGTNWDGNAVPNVGTLSCSDWTSSAINVSSSWGLATVVDYWSYYCYGGACSWTAPIYCFQQ
jgi:cysteine-rich repeat protein